MRSVAHDDVAGKGAALPGTARAPGRARLSWGQTSRALLVGAVSIAGWVALWELASAREWELVFFRFENIPAPSEVLKAGADLLSDPKLGSHVWNSLRRIFTGFGLAALLAVGIGLGIGRLRLARESLLPPLEVLRPVPAVAWIPLSILLFASAEESMVFITFIGAFFPILLNGILAFGSLPVELGRLCLSTGASTWRTFWHVRLPAALPQLFVGIKGAAVNATVGATIAEWIGGDAGLGYYIQIATGDLRMDLAFAIIIVLAALGLALFGAVALLERILIPWHISQRAPLAGRTAGSRASHGFADVRQPLVQEVRDVAIVEGIEHHPPFTPRPDQAKAAQQPQLMRHRRLRQGQHRRQVTNAQLAV